MTDVIGDVIKREGGYSNDPVDAGKETQFGISKVSNPDAWKNGPPTEAEARAIYEAKYIDKPGFRNIKDKQLQTQLIDFGINSGIYIAVQKLQEILGVTADGVLGPKTLAALDAHHADDINTALAVARMKMICKIVQKNPTNIKFLLGWISRCCEFLK